MNTQIKIYEPGLEQHPLSNVILGNTLMLLWLGLGTLACWFLSPLIAWIYLGGGLLMVFIVLRRLVCTDCYYYGKWCPIGWGKLAALLFKPGKVENFPNVFGLKLAPLTYGILSALPLVLLIISIFRGFSWFKIITLVLLLLISAYSGGPGRKKSCVKCKMKLACPGCAAK